MISRSVLISALAALAIGSPARAALVLEFIQVPSIDAGPATGPALTTMPAVTVGDTIFLQIALRDTTGSTLPWSLNGNDSAPGGPGSLALYAHWARFDGAPGIAINPGPVTPSNAALVDPVNFLPNSNGSNPPVFTQLWGGFSPADPEIPGVVPDPGNQNRIALVNLRILAVGSGTAIFQLRDPHPAPTFVDTAVVYNWDHGPANPATYQSIDDLIFGASSTNTFNMTVTVNPVPEPTSLALCGLAAAAVGWRRLRRTGR